MTRKTIISSGFGKLALFFLITGVVGVILQFIYFYLPLIPVAGGNIRIIIIYILGIVALAIGAIAIILSFFKTPKILWILLCFLVLGLTFVPPILYAVQSGTFPYIDPIYAQIGFYLTIPTNPLLDFIGFWIASGGTLISMIFGFIIPKK